MQRRRLAIALALTSALALTACTSHDDATPGPSGGPTSGSTGEADSLARGHVNNPFAGATMYVNSAWSANVRATADEYASSDEDLAESMRAVAEQPTAVWLDRIAAIEGTESAPGLRFHLDEALAQSEGSTPLVMTIVVYDLPGRDCFALASNGELPATDAGLERYRQDYIDAIVSLLSKPEYEGIRVAAVIEPDSLPNITTNSSATACQQAAPYYKAGVAYALDALHALPNVYTYVDAAHSGWLGWDNNASGAVGVFADVARSTKAGFDSIDGFVTDTANTTPLEEPFLTSGDAQVGGQQVKQSKYYEFNPIFDEADWTADLYRRLVAAGFPSSIGMLIDTSRNGWGGPDRPTAASTSTDLETYVSESRVDRRVHRGAWCNPDGAGLGRLPQALPDGYADSHLDAFVWVKPPGESDGSSSEIDNDEGKGFDPMCDPSFVPDRLGGKATRALADAPISGRWFAAQFAQLVANAYPAVGEPMPASRQDPDATKPAASSDKGGAGSAAGAGAASGAPTDGPAAPDGYLDPAAPCSASLKVDNTWEGGFQATVTVMGHRDIGGWTATFTLPSGTAVGDLWNGKPSAKTGTVAVSNVDWNGSLSQGDTAEFGLTGTGAAPAEDVAVACTGS